MDLEGTNLDIIVSPNQSQDDSRGRPIEMKNPEDLSSLKRQVYVYALKDMWKQAESIFNKHPHMVRIPLTVSTGDTALHAALSANSITFVNGLVKLMTPQDLEIKNINGETAFCTAAVAGKGAFFPILIGKNPDLPLISSCGEEYGELYEMLPVHLAASNGHHETVNDLSSDNLVERMDADAILRLFLMTIENGMFDVATKLFEKNPHLAAARVKPTEFIKSETYPHAIEDRLYPTALHMLARKRPQELSMGEDKNEGACLQLLQKLWYHVVQLNILELQDREEDKNEGPGLELLKKLWCQVRQLKSREIMGLITRPSLVMFDAIESGNVEAVKWILYMNRELLTVNHPDNERNLLHYSVLYRRRNLFYFMLKMSIPEHMLQAVDRDGNNLLHFAAFPRQYEVSARLRPNIQMRNELTWFKEVEKRVTHKLRKKRNKKGKTPYVVFYDEHAELSKEIEVTAKGTAESGMVVAILVAAVAFASALTAPGDKSNAWFIVFILANAVALFASFASILCFLSNVTSPRLTESTFDISLHRMRLITGPALLFVSIVALVVSFTAASFLIFDHTSKWVAYVVTVMAFIPIRLVLWFQDWEELIQSISIPNISLFKKSN